MGRRLTLLRTIYPDGKEINDGDVCFIYHFIILPQKLHPPPPYLLDSYVRSMCMYSFLLPHHQGWGQFNSRIGIAVQFQFRNWNWNWNWWNWKWNWNWKPWNWNWNWKPELNFLQLLLRQLLVHKPFPNFNFNRGGRNLSCDWLFMQHVFLGHCPPVVWSQKTHGQGTLFPLSGQRPEGLKMVTKDIAYHRDTSNGSWCIGIKGEMSGTVCVTFTWDIYIYMSCYK